MKTQVNDLNNKIKELEEKLEESSQRKFTLRKVYPQETCVNLTINVCWSSTKMFTQYTSIRYNIVQNLPVLPDVTH